MRILRLTFLLLTAGYWMLLACSTHIPPKYVPRVGISDKLEHFLAFGLLAGLLAMTCWSLFPARAWLIWTILIIGMVYGACDELTQPLTGRTCDFDDWVADAVGTMAGVLPVAILQRFVHLPGSKKYRPRHRAKPDFAPDLDIALAAFTSPDTDYEN